MNELDSNSVSDVDAVEAVHEPAFRYRVIDANPRTLARSAGDDAREALSDAVAEEESRRGFADPPFDFRRSVFLLRAVASELRELFALVRRPLP